jgi:hypothetical protein
MALGLCILHSQRLPASTAAARGPITGITVIAGLASTIGWPLSAFLDATLGWGGARLTWAPFNLLLDPLLNRFLIPRAPPPDSWQSACVRRQRSGLFLTQRWRKADSNSGSHLWIRVSLGETGRK